MPRISVIIPVYNTGSRLNRTLASVLQQTLTDMEIICINDGSEDDSLACLHSWEERDPRMRIIHFDQNRGVSVARNAGIDSARAPYLYFMDSDDWIDGDFLAAMYAKAVETGQDVVVNGSMVLEYEDADRKRELVVSRITAPGYYPAAFVQSHMLSVLVTRLYRRDYILRNGIRFPDLRHGGEDNFFVSLAEVLQPESYVFFGPYYHYLQRNGSLSHQEGKGFSYIQSYRLLYDELVARNISPEGMRLFYCDIFNIATREQFDYIRHYLTEAGDAILKQRDHYTVLDNLLFDAVLSSPDYDSFQASHHTNMAIAYLRDQLKNHRNNG